MDAVWIVILVVAMVGAIIVLWFLMKVLAAAGQLQRNVQVLGDCVSAELRRIGGDMSDLAENIDTQRRR